MMSEEELTVENLSIKSDTIGTKQRLVIPRENYNLSRRSRAISAISELETSSRVSSPASQASSGLTGRIHNSSPLSPNTRPFGIARRHTSSQRFPNASTPSDTCPNSPLPTDANSSAQDTSTIASTLSRYRHSRNYSLSSIKPDSKRPESVSSSTSNQCLDVRSLPSTSRPVSRQRFQHRSRACSKTGTSVYSTRVPTQILINSLIEQLEKEIEGYDTTPDKWAQYKSVKAVLSELEAVQADSTFPPAEVTEEQYTSRFDHLVLWVEKTHADRLKHDAIEKENRNQSESIDPFPHLTGDFRRLALQGVQPFLLPPFTYPTELPLLHVEPIRSVERGWGLQLVEDVEINTPVLQMPNHLFMSSTSAVFHPRVAEVIAGREVFFQYNSLIRLTLLLLVEALEGIHSTYADYISMLPRIPTSPLYYTADMLEPYRKALISLEIIDQTRQATRLYHAIYKHLSLTTYLNRNNFTWAAFKWAYSIVLTRAIALPLPTPPLLDSNNMCGIQEFGLVPILDQANFSHNGIIPLYNPLTACLEVVPSKTLSAGTELFLRWPMLNNRELFIRYGICADTALSGDYMRMTLSLPATNRDADAWNRFVLCQSIRLPSSNTYPLHRGPVARTSRELLQFILIITLDIATLHAATSKADIRPAPGRPFLRDRIQALRFIDAMLGEPPAEGEEETNLTPALQTALSWLRVTLQVHLRLALKVGDLDSAIRSLNPNLASSYPMRWFLQILRHEQRFVRSCIDEFDGLLGGKSILDD
ncbi:hypothetical protein DSO57_1033319 [Entomophthora muscae]|uniref:Uncharacterized protein n=1 Tax=Entomophthora muscae TaxID=34485 RepID=A0ACC2TAV7_9FUNG|nr:hypothetical protein DSO57_1033319 [Entomophthora muscae]